MSSAGKSICKTVCMQTNPFFSFQNKKEHKSEDFIHAVHSWLDTSQCKVRKYVGSWWFWRVISLTRENIFIPNQKWISIRSLYYHICVICPCCLLHRSVTASDPSVVHPYRLPPPGQYSKLFFITNLRELPPQSDPLWLTNPLPSPPAAPAIISPTTLSATSALPALCGQQIHDELEPDPPLSSVWLSASLSRTLSGDRGSWSRRQMTTWILHFTPGALTGSCQGIKTTS